MTTYLAPIVLTETKTSALVAKLDSVPLGRMYQASFKAAVRLHLWFTGRTHELFGEFVSAANAKILKAGGSTQLLDSASGFAVQSELLKLWGDVFQTWQSEFYKVRVEAASIPFGVLAVFHERLLLPVVEATLTPALSRGERGLTESVEDGVFSPQLSVVLNAASEHLYGDALNLSARVWNVDRGARDAIAEVILRGVTNRLSAWQVAQELEQYLGANQDCPRWTATRLYGRTKSNIAQGDTTGLVSKPCDGQGVAYNALRLARTEIQKAHALATDRIMQAQPWVKQEQIHLSEAHPEPDICDEVAHGGEDGKGIYEVGTQELPFHPNCLCYKTAVLMDEKAFTSQMNGWLNGEAWSEMDGYAALVSGSRSQVSGEAVNVSLLANAVNLAVWLFGDEGQLGAISGL